MVSAKAMSARICEGCEGFCEGRPSPINRMHNQGLSSIVKGVKGFLPPYMRARVRTSMEKTRFSNLKTPFTTFTIFTIAKKTESYLVKG